MTIIMTSTQSPTFPSAHLHHNSFSNPSVALPNEQSSFSKISITTPTLQLILQSLRCITYVTALPNEQRSFSKLSIISPPSQLILQPFRCFTYITAHSSTLPLLHLHLAHSPTLLSLILHHRLFTYVTWRAAMSSAHSLSFPSLHLCHSSF